MEAAFISISVLQSQDPRVVLILTAFPPQPAIGGTGTNAAFQFHLHLAPPFAQAAQFVNAQSFALAHAGSPSCRPSASEAINATNTTSAAAARARFAIAVELRCG